MRRIKVDLTRNMSHSWGAEQHMRVEGFRLALSSLIEYDEYGCMLSIDRLVSFNLFFLYGFIHATYIRHG
jgi:hypothetical protein